MKKKVKEPVRMEYQTYAHIKYLFEKEMASIENEYRIACKFIPSESYIPRKLSGLDKAHKIFSLDIALRRHMLEELHAVAEATYADHPNPEMRKFWGLEQIN